MSGGVDSSVAAALLVEQGHDVIGLSMQLYDQSSGALGRCCTLDDLHDARRVATALGFPHYIVNFERQFADRVIADFVREYASGRTPIPCAHCNSDLKFSTLLDRARALDAECVATGHYARVERAADGRWILRRGADESKDQTYFLFSLTQDQLAHALFPVGSLAKPAVREVARRFGLAVADKSDSQELCFVPAGDHAAFVEGRTPVRRGTIVTREGRTVGTHGGVHAFTVGQRRGLGVALGEPMYVLKIDADTGTVTVGPKSALDRRSFTVSRANWIATDAPTGWMAATVQIRHRHRPAPGRVRALEGARAEIELDEPQPAVAPGQAAVFYAGDSVLGGGWID
jgi:tRNA-specific 2-thiouridylase